MTLAAETTETPEPVPRGADLSVEAMRQLVLDCADVTRGNTAGLALRRFLRTAIWGYPPHDDSDAKMGEPGRLSALLGVAEGRVRGMRSLEFPKVARHAVSLGITATALSPRQYVIAPSWAAEEPIPPEAYPSGTEPAPYSAELAHGWAEYTSPGLALHRALCAGQSLDPQSFGAKAACARLLKVELGRYSQIIHRPRIQPVFKYALRLRLCVQGSPSGWIVGQGLTGTDDRREGPI